MFAFQKRSVEDLKERYYNICGKLTKVRAASGTEPKIYIFDAGHERRRKEQLEKLFNRTPEQVSIFVMWFRILKHFLSHQHICCPVKIKSNTSNVGYCSNLIFSSLVVDKIALPYFYLQVAEEEYLIQELRKIETRKKEREKKAQDLQKLIKAADTTTELRRAEKRVSKKKLPQKRETEKPVWYALAQKEHMPVIW